VEAMMPGKRAKKATRMSHFARYIQFGQFGAIQKRGQTMTTFEFPKYRRSQFEERNLTSDRAGVTDTAEMSTEDLGDLLGRVSENSTTQIDNLVGEFGRLREKLRVDGERIQREVEEYRALSEQVIQMTKTISESVEKVRASVNG
jgi:hypothetical protein